MTTWSTVEIESRVRSFSTWYHNIDLGGVQTNPANPDYPASRWRLIEPHVPADLSGATVLDLGCNAGYFAIQMRRRGASVVGVDWSREAIDQAVFVAEVLDLDIDYRLQNIYQFVLECRQVFDYVVFLGVLYHTRYPLLILDRLAQIVGRRMYFQTIVKERVGEPGLVVPGNVSSSDVELLTDPRFPRLAFVEHELDGAYNNWFVANTGAVEAMLRSAGFADLVHAGEDCWVCGPANQEAAWRLSHDLEAIRGS
jgi:tRNA (mo5U34)-methyltransferase